MIFQKNISFAPTERKKEAVIVSLLSPGGEVAFSFSSKSQALHMAIQNAWVLVRESEGLHYAIFSIISLTTHTRKKILISKFIEKREKTKKRRRET